MGIQGTGLKSGNARLRMLLIIFFGIAAMGGVLWWRTKTFDEAERSSKMSRTNQLNGELRSKNFQVEVKDATPAVEQK